MHSGRVRRGRAWIVSGIVATAVVVAGAGPAPGQQPEPLGPEVEYVDGYGPMRFGYEDCDGTVHTEDDQVGWIFVELDDAVEDDVAVAITLTGDDASGIDDHLVDVPPAVEIPAGESWGEASFGLEEIVDGELTVTVLPGPGYQVDEDDDSYTWEVSEEPELVLSCLDDLGTPPRGTDRQTIDVGEKPAPIGFFEDYDDDDCCSDDGEATTTEAIADGEELSEGFRLLRDQRIAPRATTRRSTACSRPASPTRTTSGAVRPPRPAPTPSTSASASTAPSCCSTAVDRAVSADRCPGRCPT